LKHVRTFDHGERKRKKETAKNTKIKKKTKETTTKYKKNRETPNPHTEATDIGFEELLCAMGWKRVKESTILGDTLFELGLSLVSYWGGERSQEKPIKILPENSASFERG